jgi:hypothetical protein
MKGRPDMNNMDNINFDDLKKYIEENKSLTVSEELKKKTLVGSQSEPAGSCKAGK